MSLKKIIFLSTYLCNYFSFFIFFCFNLKFITIFSKLVIFITLICPFIVSGLFRGVIEIVIGIKNIFYYTYSV